MAAKRAKIGLNDTVLPPEIWREVLVRVPVKSILRCRSVCKSWYSLVSCPSFISHNTNLHNKYGNRVLLQLGDVESRPRSFISHDMHMDMESSERHNDYTPDRLMGPDNLVMVGSCNGLICLFERANSNNVSTVTFLIWNPAIRKIVDLPSITYRYGTQRLTCIGFGFDSITSDYKVMCNLRRHHSWEENIQESACQIFDLSMGVWRSISPLMPSQIPRFPVAECYVNGAVHWSKVSDRIVLSFSMSDESFREIRMPDCAEFAQSGDNDRIETQCVTFGGLVHVIVWKTMRDDYAVDVSESCSLWAMKEYGVTESWIKVSNIDLPSAQVLPSAQLCPESFILWAKHEILMVQLHQVHEGNKTDLVLYNTKSKISKRLFSTTKYVRNLCLYKESRVLM